MTDRPIVLHLVDDTTAGGVTRVLDFIRTNPDMAAIARHEVKVVARNRSIPALSADMIVSHLSISWRSLPVLIALRARHAGLPLVHVEHSYTEAFTALNVPFKVRFFTLLRNAYALFDRVVAVSEEQGAWMRRRGLVSREALQVIRSAVDLGRFRALPAPAGPALRIGAIGRLDRQKGFDVLIEAFRELTSPEISLHFYGTGSEEQALRALAKGDPRIHFHGHSAVPEEALASVDVVAMPSRWEAFGLVALEARAAGRRLVVSDLDGLKDSAGIEAQFVTGHGVQDWRLALQAALDAGTAAPARAPGAEQEFADRWNHLVQLCLDRGEPLTRMACGRA